MVKRRGLRWLDVAMLVSTRACLSRAPLDYTFYFFRT